MPQQPDKQPITKASRSKQFWDAVNNALAREDDIIKKCGYEHASKMDKYNLAISYELFMKD